MKEVDFYGAGFPYRPIKELGGKLIVLEGTGLWYDVAVKGEVRHPGPGIRPSCASGGVAWRLL